MADIEQNLQEIEQERSRLRTAKANLKTAIIEKGVTVADDIKLDQYYTLVNNIQVGGGVDTSDATVTDSDIVMGKIGYGKDGKVYGSRKYVEDATVYFSDGKLCTSEPVYLDPNNPVTMYSFDVFTDPTYIAEGYQAYVGGGLVTGTMIRLGAGSMIIREGGTLDIPYIGYYEYASMDMKKIHGVGDLAAENIAYGKTICGITGTFGGSIPSSPGDYVLPDDFTLDIKLAFWNMYSPVQTEIVPFKGGTNNDRVWESDSWRLRYNTDKWIICYIGLGSEDEQARNSKLAKHGWELINFTTPDGAKSFDFISLEDKDWTYSE